LVALAFPQVARRLPRSSTAISVLRVRYPDGRGILRHLLRVTTEQGFAIDEVSTGPNGRVGRASAEQTGANEGGRMVEVTMHVHGKGSVNDLAVILSELDEVDAVVAGDVNSANE
jgi:putative Mg2+ transporter-C (MgtC) family protein